MDSLHALSPLDGRYAARLDPLRPLLTLARFLEDKPLNAITLQSLQSLRPDNYVGLARELALKGLTHG